MELTHKSMFKGRDFISLADFSKKEIKLLLETAHVLKAKQKAGISHQILKGKTLGMIFTKSSTRTRVSFEVGIFHLGGQGIFLSNRDIQIGRGESIKDTARVLSRMLDGIMIRTFEHQEVVELAKFSTIPVINGLTDLLHPTQVLADLMTIEEYKGKGKLEGLKLAYIGDGNNMAHSLMIGAGKMGLDVTIACPQNYRPNEMIITLATKQANENGGSVRVVTDPLEAATDADVLYTDVWASMGQEEEAQIRQQAFKGYQINRNLMKVAKKDAIVMHCLPAHLGEEITEEVFEGPQSVAFDEAENRLHAHKAIMALFI